MVSPVTYPIKGLEDYPEQTSTFSKCGLSLPAGISRLCMYRKKHISFVSTSLSQQSRPLTQDTRNRSGVRNRSFFMRRQKKTPPKAGSLGFSLGLSPSFHSVKKPSSQLNYSLGLTNVWTIFWSRWFTWSVGARKVDSQNLGWQRVRRIEKSGSDGQDRNTEKNYGIGVLGPVLTACLWRLPEKPRIGRFSWTRLQS